MKKTYTPEAKSSNVVAPSAPLYCGLIQPPPAAKEQGVSSRHIITVAGIFHRETNGLEVRNIFGKADFVEAAQAQAEEKKKSQGDAFDGNYLYNMAQQSFYRFYNVEDTDARVPAVLYCWQDTVDGDASSPASFVYEHRLVLMNRETGKFDLQRPDMVWTDPKQNPLTIVQARKDIQRNILNKFYSAIDDVEVWSISEWHPDAVKRMEKRERLSQPNFAADMFGVQPARESIHNAVTKLDNRTKQLINNVLRRELGKEVFLDKKEGRLIVRDCAPRKSAQAEDINSMGNAFAAIA